MFGGIGAKGTKKDLKQTRKNIRRKKLQEQQEQWEKKKKEKRKKDVLQDRTIVVPRKKKVGISLIEPQKEKMKTSDTKTTEVSPKMVDINYTIPIEKKEKTVTMPKKKQEIPKVKGSTSSKTLDDVPIYPPENNTKVETTEQKKEQELFLEQKVITQLESILKEQRYQLKKLSFELEVLEKESSETYQCTEIEEYIDKMNRLLERLLKIKKELEIVLDDQKLDFIYQLDDNYLKKLVSEYKEVVSTQEVNDKMHNLKKEELYTSVMDTILLIEQKEEELAKKLEEKRKKCAIDEENLEILQDKYIDISKVAKDLENLVKEAEEKLEEVSRKVNEAVSVTTKMQIQTRHALGLLERSILLFSLFRMNPRPKANAITALEVLVATNLIKNMFKPREEVKEIKTFHYHDYQNFIESTAKDMDSISSLIDYSIHELIDVKNTFLKDFGEHLHELPIYHEFLTTIEIIEKELLEKEENMKKIKEELSLNLDKNKEKVYHYEQLNRNN